MLEILKILTRFYVDTIHRIYNHPRPVIIQFVLRTYREKVWKAARDHPSLKERDVRLEEDLTFAEKQQRKMLWPRVTAAKRGREIDGEKLLIEMNFNQLKFLTMLARQSN